MIIRSGEGAILVGGTSQNAKPTTPGETRGDGVEGGTRYKLAPGDMIYVPAGYYLEVWLWKRRQRRKALNR